MTMIQPSFGAAPGVTLFGVGGAGGNAVARLFRRADTGMKIISANTDMQALRAAPSASQIQLGRTLTRGLGAGANPEIGRAAAEEALPEIVRALEGTALCFIAAGMGGGTGTGAAPVIARAARERGILTIGVATRPFAFEGQRRARIAAAGIAEFHASVDAMVVVCNENLFHVIGKDTTFRAAIELSDTAICESATDLASLIAGPALKRLSVADIRSTLKSGGRSVIGYGECRSGQNRAAAAAASALSNPLLEDVALGAQRLLVTVAGGNDLGLFEVEEAIAWLQDNVQPGVELVWGSVMDPALDGRMRVGIVAAGLPERDAQLAPIARRASIKAVNAPAARTEPAPRTMFAPAAMPTVAAQPPAPSAPRPQPRPETVERPVMAAMARDLATPAPPPVPVAGAAPIADISAPTATIRPLCAIPVATVIDVPTIELRHDFELLLTSADALDVRVRAGTEQIRASRPIRSRGSSASLVDRIYFATRDLKRNWERRDPPSGVPAMPRPSRAPRLMQPGTGLTA